MSDMFSVTGDGNGRWRRLPTCGPIAPENRSPSSSRRFVTIGSAITRRTDDAKDETRPLVSWIPTASLREDSSWWASSKMTILCSGRMLPLLAMCAPYSAMLTTTTFAVDAASRARSAKQFAPTGHLLLPGHSSVETLMACLARSDGMRGSSSKSPVFLFLASLLGLQL